MCDDGAMAIETSVLIPGAEPLSVDGGRIGVLLSHGFTGSPVSMRPWGQHLADAGFTVRVPLLPGHGTRWQDLNRTRWPDWYSALDRALDDLVDRCDAVVACGLSMGGALVLRLAERRPADIDALVVVNPAVHLEHRALPFVKYLRHVVPAIQGIAGDIKKPGAEEAGYSMTPLHALHSQTELWADVRAHLSRITQPLLYFRSPEDHVVDDSSTPIIMNGVSSSVAELRELFNSYHVATVDHDAERIFAEADSFIADHVGQP